MSYNKSLTMAVITSFIISAFLFGGCIGSETESIDAKKAEIEGLVNEACDMIESHGPDFFTELREEDSDWWYGDTYVFVWQTDGLRVVYPPDTLGEGVDMSNLEDPNGKPIGELFIQIAVDEPHHGWVEYQWPRPNSEKAEEKQTYIKRAIYDGMEYLVGSGLYISDYS